MHSVFENNLTKSVEKVVEERIETTPASKEVQICSQSVKENFENAYYSLLFITTGVPEKSVSNNGKKTKVFWKLIRL